MDERRITAAGIDYTIIMSGPGMFTMQDYDEILGELRRFWSAMPNPY